MATPSPGTVRALGWLLIVLGIGLSGSMVWLIQWLQQLLTAPAAGAQWKGTPEFTRATFGLFYSVLGFGLISVVGGTYQVMTGRRSRVVAAVTVLAMVPLGWFLYLILTGKPPR